MSDNQTRNARVTLMRVKNQFPGADVTLVQLNSALNELRGTERKRLDGGADVPEGLDVILPVLCKYNDKLQAAVAAEGESSGPATREELVREFRTRGLTELKLRHLERWYRELKMFTPNSRLTPEWEELLRQTLTWAVNVNQILQEDRQALSVWEQPDAAELAGQNPYRFTGICGHEVVVSAETIHDRWSNTASGASPLLRLCTDCRGIRISLLKYMPGAAQPDSVCSICGEHRFRQGNDGGQVSFAMSRGEGIWENLISGTYSIYDLPSRLNPQHGPHHPKHKALYETNKKVYEAYRADLELRYGAILARFPARATQVRAALREELEEKQIELFGVLMDER